GIIDHVGVAFGTALRRDGHGCSYVSACVQIACQKFLAKGQRPPAEPNGQQRTAAKCGSSENAFLSVEGFAYALSLA
ncbi:hypothetical protein NPIL_190411, partial [Nephila pilipes]